MNDDGYTLIEMLAALVIIGLAIGGLTQAVRVIGLAQARAVSAIKEEHALRAVGAGLGRLVEGRGPFASDQAGGLRGSSSELAFDCGAATPCAASARPSLRGSQITLAGPSGTTAKAEVASASDLTFDYGGDQTAGDRWPPRGDQRQKLAWVAMVGGTSDQPTPIAATRIWREEVPDCVFDIVAQACRATNP